MNYVEYVENEQGRKIPVHMSGFKQGNTVNRWVTVISHVVGIIRQQMPMPAEVAAEYGPDDVIYSVSRMLMVRMKLQIMLGLSEPELREGVRELLGYSPKLTEEMIDVVLERSREYEFNDDDFESASNVMGLSSEKVRNLMARYEAAQRSQSIIKPVKLEQLMQKVPRVRKPNTKPKSRAAKRAQRKR